MSTSIAPAQLQALFPAAAAVYLLQVCDELNVAPEAYGLDTAPRKAHFFAQIRQESGAGLDAMVESLAYSPQALISTFGYYRGRPAEAAKDGYDRDPVTRRTRRAAAQQTIANKAYGNRNGDGDIASGDGWRFRGRGLVQVTGRANYAAIDAQCRTLYPGLAVDFVDDPDAMGVFPGSVRSAVAFWVMNGLHKLADRGTTGADVDRITAVINAKTDSYADRRANFITALNAFR